MKELLQKDFSITFSPDNTGTENAVALQQAVNQGGIIKISEPGTYDIADTIVLGGDTTLIFSSGVVLRRQHCYPFDGNAFINRGAFTGKADKNITIKGLNLSVNGVEFTAASEECEKTVLGLRGHLSFLYIENLHLENIEITGLEKIAYGIQICNFKDVTVDTVYIEGKKDGIHFGPGNGFVLRNGTFKTADDPIALNADDYSVSNPTLGVIENGLIENCRDLYEDINAGYFVRILSGSWVDWYPGMKVQHSDSVVYNGRLYRVVMSPSFEQFVSVTPPDFEKGFQTLDGIRWAKTGYEAVYHSYVKNITFKNIFLEKARDVGISFSIEQNEYRRGYYENSELISNGSFVFDNVNVSADVTYPIAVLTPVEQIEIKNSNFGHGRLLVSNENQAGIQCPPMKLMLKNNSFEYDDIICKDRKPVL